MRTWDVTLDLGAPAEVPLYRRIARGIAADVERGRLRPGERLTSTRILAEQLGVNRNTIVAAFEELRAQGWIEGRSTRGTFVARTLPAHRADDAAPSTVGFDLPEPLPEHRPLARRPGLRLLLGGVPDLRLLPHRELARAWRRALQGSRGRRAVDYADPQGNERLRVALGELVSRARGVHAPPASISVVRGSQQGLYLVARALVRPGDVVAVEALGFPPGWEAMRLAGAELVPIPIDEDGMDVARLEALCERRRVRAVVVTPHHQHPT